MQWTEEFEGTVDGTLLVQRTVLANVDFCGGWDDTEDYVC